MLRILFVCTGNTCRSPMAEALFNKLVSEQEPGQPPLPEVRALSAGLAAFPGDPASRHARTVMAEKGIDLSGHQAKQLTAELVKEADIILTMTSGHKSQIVADHPDAAAKTFTLKEYVQDRGDVRMQKAAGLMPGRELDIEDPFGQNVERYRSAAEDIEKPVRALIAKLRKEYGPERSGIARGKSVLKIAIGSDHAGYDMKNDLLKLLAQWGHTYHDFGTYSSDSVDYPDIAKQVARAVASGEFDRGVLVCGTGIGMSIAANKVKGVRAALCSDPLSARMSREHNDANVLALGARIVGGDMAAEILRSFLAAEPDPGERHRRRVEKIGELENE